MSAIFVLPRQCYGVAVFSPHAHAVIKSIDVAAAKAAPGVVCVLTGADAFDRQGQRHSAVLHAGIVGRPEGISDHASGSARRSRPPRRRLCRLRRCRNRGAGARCRGACGRRLRAAARADRSRRGGETARTENLERLPERQCRGDDWVRRQGRDRRRLRRRQARCQGSPRQQPRHRQSDRAALRARRL